MTQCRRRFPRAASREHVFDIGVEFTAERGLFGAAPGRSQPRLYADPRRADLQDRVLGARGPGADFAAVRPDGVIENSYPMETDDGTRIYIRNIGDPASASAGIDRISKGRPRPIHASTNRQSARGPARLADALAADRRRERRSDVEHPIFRYYRVN
jgi:hypothetical protein